MSATRYNTATLQTTSFLKDSSSENRYVTTVFHNDVNLFDPIIQNQTDQVIQHIRGFLFRPCYHPFMENILEKLNQEGFDSIFSLLDKTDQGTVFSKYQPNTTSNPPLVQSPLPEERFYFDINEPYAQDNWMTFYHIIVLIVETLLANNKNDEAIRWIESCLYNPKTIQTKPDPKYAGLNSKYWKLPVFKGTPAESTAQFFNDIMEPDLQEIVCDLQANPFNPFVVAYRRPQEFMMHVVNLYVKAHIAQGDIHFRTAYNGGGMDFLNLALEYYKIAKIQLGERPQTIPNILKKRPETYQSLKKKGLNPAVNLQVQYENIFPFCSQYTLKTGDTSKGSLLGGGHTFYFSIPPDTATNELFDKIDDRLGKLRSCKDIDGILRKIDLFGTPINPEQLLSALANGLSLGEILGGLYAPAPIYRFLFLIQKAKEICNEVRVLGNAIVSSIEKRDSEQLALLRSTNETAVLNRITPIKERQVYEAEIQKQSLLKSRDTSKTKLNHYQQLLGMTGTNVPEPPALPENPDSTSMVPTDIILAPASPQVDVSLVDTNEMGVKIIPKEQTEINSMWKASEKHSSAGIIEQIGAFMNAIPGFSIRIAPIGVGAGMNFGGSNVAAIFSGIAKGIQNDADSHSYDSNIAAKFSGYIRREQEWALQVNLSEKEIIQLDKQIVASDIRIQIAEKELGNHYKQIQESQQLQDFMVNKESNYVVYQQIMDKLKTIHKNFYDLALYYARSAEQAYQFEKPEKIVDFISYNYNNSIVGCATVADQLNDSLNQMEKSYLVDSPRPHEMRINIQLSRLDPMALFQLRKTGKADIIIPEWYLLLKNRGIYNAKWISANFTFPMISGPYINMNALVTMQENFIRIKAAGGDPQNFPRQENQIDDRFVQNNTPFKEVLISNGLNDPGYNLDAAANANEIYQQQYHPFVHAGVISKFSIDLNNKQRDQNTGEILYDYSELNWDSLSDVIISGVISVDLDYGSYKTDAENYLNDLFTKVDSKSLSLFLDLKHDFSNELNLFQNNKGALQFDFNLDQIRFPYIAQNKIITLKEMNVITTSDLLVQTNNFINKNQIKFEKNTAIGNYSVFVASKLIDNKTDLSFEINNNPTVIKLELIKEKASETFIVFKYIMKKKS
ncbi:MAG: hypothetical protein WCS03_17335 [Bacteroidota bacterium]